MRRTAMIAVATCLFLAADDPPTSQKDAQSRFEPYSAPGAGQRLLARFAGEWDVIKTFYPQSGQPIRAKGRCRQTMIHDGRFLQSEFVFEQNGKSSTGLGIIGFEPETGVFTSFWTDSRQTRMSIRRSRDPFDGGQIVLYSKSLEPDRKDSRPSKTVSRLADEGRTLIHRQYALGPNGEERLMMDLVMTRKSAAAAPSR